MPNYIVSATSSDLSGLSGGSGQVGNRKLLEGSEGANTVSKAIGAADDAYLNCFTEPAVPGITGTSSGTFSVVLRAETTGGTTQAIALSVRLDRVNSSGVSQANTGLSAEQSTSINSFSDLTFTFTDPALGTWVSGDRLRVAVRCRTTGLAGRTINFETGGTHTLVAVPPGVPFGTQAAVIGTEHVLWETTAASRRMRLSVDTSVMLAGDELELRVYKMGLSGGTRRVAYFARYTGVQPTNGAMKVSRKISTALSDSGALRFTLKQVAGTGRSFPWVVDHA